MSDQKFVRYGDRTMPLEPGMTLEAVKELMARHFPELADPKVETKKDGEKVTYVFTKQAGRKGATLTPTLSRKSGEGVGVAVVVRAIEHHCIEYPILPPDALRLVQRGDVENVDVDTVRAVVAQLREQADAVRATADALLDAPMAGGLTGSVL